MNGRVDTPEIVGPGLDSPVSSTWQRLPGTADPIVDWRREDREEKPRLLCNGILVQSGGLPPLWHQDGLKVHCPTLSIFDFFGTLPLDLTRTKLLLEQLPFAVELTDDIARDYIAFMLTSVPPLKAIIARRQLFGFPHVSATFGEAAVMPWVVTKRGMAPLDGSVLGPLGLKRLLFPQVEQRWSDTTDWYLGRAAALLHRGLRTSDGVVFATDLMKLVETIGSDKVKSPLGLNTSGFRVLGSEPELAEVIPRRERARRESLRDRDDDEYMHRSYPRWSVASLALFEEGTCDGSSEHLRSLAVQYLLSQSRGDNASHRDYPLVACEVHLLPVEKNNTQSPVVRAWQKYCSSEMIPLDSDERQIRLASAFESLGVYVRAWKDLVSQWQARNEHYFHWPQVVDVEDLKA